MIIFKILSVMSDIKNPKSEYRNPKFILRSTTENGQTQNSNDINSKHFSTYSKDCRFENSDFEPSILFRISDFVLRI